MQRLGPLSFLLALLFFSDNSSGADSTWVRTGSSGRLIYVPDAEGDRVLDFSGVGYQGRGVAAIPDDVATAITISPVGGDDTASIQTAIDTVSALPIGPDGYRGAVELSAGSYDIESQLEIRASGVVLRGAGQGESGTVLHGRNTGGAGTNQRPLIRVYGSGGISNTGSERILIDKVVPAGATSFRVNVPSTFVPGDKVRVVRNSNAQWISDIGMDAIPPRADGGTVNQWSPSSTVYRYDRTVTRVEGDRIFIDAPLPNAIEQHYGGGTIRKYNATGAIENIGIEGIRGVSDYDSDTDEDHAWEFISIGINHVSSRAENVWVRNIHGKHFGDSLVVANPGTKWVTVANAVNEDPKSIVTGGRRYSFDLSGELGFVTNAHADSGRHDFVNNSTAPKGPNVFHNSTATNAFSDTGPHQRWATGTLFDNVTVQGNGINARNRLNLGSGHGWSGSNMVVWNSTANSFIVQNPPTSQNWLIGSTGTIVEDAQFGPQPAGNYDSHGAPVTVGGTDSLYEAQLNDSSDIREFHWGGGDGSWSDATGWNQDIAPGVYAVSMRDFLIGDIDDYTYDGLGSVDDAFVDAGWEAYIQGSSSHPLVGFDTVGPNQNVAFTAQHTLDAGEQLIHASLALAMRGAATGNTSDDFLRIVDSNYRFDFDALGWDTQLNSHSTFVGVLDLSTVVDQLQSGSLNVQVSNDTAVEWAMYIATVATPIADLDGPDVFLDAGGTVSIDNVIDPINSLSVGGSSPGHLELMGHFIDVAINADYLQASNGQLSVALGLPGQAMSSSLTVGRTATLDGTLAATMADLGGSAHNPIAGDSFEILSAMSIAGEFSELELPALDSGLVWDIEYQSTSVSLSVLLAADFSKDGIVDEADLGIWRAGYGMSSATHSEGDSNGDGVVSGADFLVWQSQYGMSSQLSAPLAVPEPASGLMVCPPLVLFIVLRKRRCRK